ncbi:MAG: transcription antitermination factor NusB [Pseudomonadota bacterium]
MGSRSRAREQALQILYFIDLTGTAVDEALRLFHANFESEEEEFEFACTLVTGITGKLAELDQKIEGCSENWRLSRMPRIDRNILRMGAFEILFAPEIPPAVAMDEAIELAKKYGEEHSPPFVNGILDRISKNREKGI